MAFTSEGQQINDGKVQLVVLSLHTPCRPRDPRRTKLTVTFLTDYGNKMTCGNPTDPNNKPYRGRASSSSGPGGEGNTDGADVRTASSRPVGRRPQNSRQLMQATSPARGRNAK